MQLAPARWGFAVGSNKNENTPLNLLLGNLLVDRASDGVWHVGKCSFAVRFNTEQVCSEITEV